MIEFYYSNCVEDLAISFKMASKGKLCTILPSVIFLQDRINMIIMFFNLHKQLHESIVSWLANLFQVYHVSKTWYSSLPENVKETINRHFGSFPDKDENIEVCCYFSASCVCNMNVCNGNNEYNSRTSLIARGAISKQTNLHFLSFLLAKLLLNAETDLSVQISIGSLGVANRYII